MKLRHHFLKAIAKIRRLKDTPHAVALGISIGIFFGFSPLFGLKTLLALGLAWALRASKTAAVISVSLHDILLPILPIFLRWEYDLGYWALNHPHELPPHIQMHNLDLEMWLHWSAFFTVGRPLLVGALLLGGPIACCTYFLALFGLRLRLSNK